MTRLALLLLFLAGSASAAEVSLDAGQCVYGLAKDGTFYQSDRYTNNYMHPRCWSVSYADRFKDSRFGYEIGWHDFGKAQGRSNMAVGDDEAFQPGVVCNPTTGVGCEAKLDTWSRVRGVETSLTATYGSDWFIKGKTGLLFYEMKTHSDITFFEGTKVEYDEHSGFLNRPAAGFGLSVGRKVNKDWSASLGFTRWLWIGEHRQLSIVENELTQYSVRVSYGF